jgi:SSS family solute:Na+ symporter
MIWLVIFFFILVGIGIFDYFRIRNFDEFVVAGRKQSEPFVLMSLLATTMGASATLGVVNLAYGIGFPAFWWLGAGSIGLIFQAIFLSEKVRAFEGYTLPHIAKIAAGEEGKLITAVVIVTSWLGIIAAQFAALADIIAVITGKPDTILLLIVTSLVIVLYTTIGGQLSILKTDALQFLLLAGGLLYSFYYLFFVSTGGSSMPVFSKIELMNDKFDMTNLVYFLFIVGGSFFIGPDVFSRNFTARNGKTARNATLKAGIFLMLFAVLITSIGMWAKELSADIDKTGVLVYVISNYLPEAASIALGLGLLAAIISSADTCIITAAAIIENDILKGKKVKNVRIFAFTIGIMALIIAILKKDIISLLLYSYSIFTPGIVCPLFIAVWFHKKRQLNKIAWISAIISGGSFGLLANVLNIKYPALIGMGLSLILSIYSISSKAGKVPTPGKRRFNKPIVFL